MFTCVVNISDELADETTPRASVQKTRVCLSFILEESLDGFTLGMALLCLPLPVHTHFDQGSIGTYDKHAGEPLMAAPYRNSLRTSLGLSLPIFAGARHSLGAFIVLITRQDALGARKNPSFLRSFLLASPLFSPTVESNMANTNYTCVEPHIVSIINSLLLNDRHPFDLLPGASSPPGAADVRAGFDAVFILFGNPRSFLHLTLCPDPSHSGPSRACEEPPYWPAPTTVGVI